jgi:hypothetical protein
MEIENTKVKIYYYGLEFKFNAGEDLNSFFNTVTQLSKTRARIRYQYFGERYVYIQGVGNEKNIITGKLRSIRDNIFPQLIKMSDDTITDLEDSGSDGVVETSHFIIDFRGKTPVLALEYNHSGAKVDDLVKYIERIGVSKQILTSVGFQFLTDENLADLQKRINRVSEFTLKIHKDDLPKVMEADGNIMESAAATVEYFENEYALLDMKFDYRKFQDTPKIKRSIFGLIKWFEDNPDKRKLFNYLNFKAEDEFNNNKLRFFDLVISKEKSEITVQKKKKSKTIISEDIFPKMQRELDIKKFR